MKSNLIMDLAFSFSLQIIELYKNMVEQKEFILSKQLLKSGTAIGASIQEALAAQSKRDFISKMSIASKEARETRYWLMLFDKSRLCSLEVKNQLEAIDSIINILTKIIKTSQLNLNQ